MKKSTEKIICLNLLVPAAREAVGSVLKKGYAEKLSDTAVVKMAADLELLPQVGAEELEQEINSLQEEYEHEKAAASNLDCRTQNGLVLRRVLDPYQDLRDKMAEEGAKIKCSQLQIISGLLQDFLDLPREEQEELLKKYGAIQTKTVFPSFDEWVEEKLG